MTDKTLTMTFDASLTRDRGVPPDEGQHPDASAVEEQSVAGANDLRIARRHRTMLGQPARIAQRRAARDAPRDWHDRRLGRPE